MATWAEDEEIVCVHRATRASPQRGAQRLEQVFAGDARLRLSTRSSPSRPSLAMQSAVEHISTVGDDAGARGGDVHQRLLRTPLGWRLVMHHAPHGGEAGDVRGPLH
jgi:hypothetical protein